jgi:hypothetical protein
MLFLPILASDSGTLKPNPSQVYPQGSEALSVVKERLLLLISALSSQVTITNLHNSQGFKTDPQLRQDSKTVSPKQAKSFKTKVNPGRGR